MEAQSSCAVTVHDSHHAFAGLNAEAVSLQVFAFGNDFVQDVHQLVGAHLHVISGELLEDPPKLLLLLVLVALGEVLGSARGRLHADAQTQTRRRTQRLLLD